MTKITSLTALDIRFPTSIGLHGSDAMNPDPDYSAAYCVLGTDVQGLEGHGMTFTIGRGNEICVAAINSLKGFVEGRSLEELTADMGRFWREVVGDSQLRWIGPEKGVIHLASAAVLNAVWDLWAKVEGKPLWGLIADMSAEELVRCVDFRFITDAITPDQAIALLRSRESGRDERESRMRSHGFPAYTTSVGWLGYTDDEVRARSQMALRQGFSHFKMKVGRDLDADIRRARLIREQIGWERQLMMDANQVWEVDQAIEWVKALAEFRPFWIEEPTSPDDVLGHARIAAAVSPIRVATGEHCHNRVMFKQFLQANAIGFLQLDSCRLGGVNEVIAVLLLAAQFGIPVCPHAGGVGLCEYVQHLSIFDYIRLGASLEDRVLEYVDHLHEHFVDPVIMRHAHYQVPIHPGYSITMKPQSLVDYQFPGGAAWNGMDRSSTHSSSASQ